jgi:hypothetical protein
MHGKIAMLQTHAVHKMYAHDLHFAGGVRKLQLICRIASLRLQPKAEYGFATQACNFTRVACRSRYRTIASAAPPPALGLSSASWTTGAENMAS